MRHIFGNDGSSGAVDFSFDFSEENPVYDVRSLLDQSPHQPSFSDATAPGPLALLDDDGALSPVTEARGSGSQTTSGHNQPSRTPAPTLVGASGGLQFNLIWDASVASAPAGFMSAAITAATLYTQLFSNREVVNVHVGYGEVNGTKLSAGALAASESYGYIETYAQVVAALKQDASSSTWQATADSNLPSSDPTNGGRFFVSTAEAKALGQVSGYGTSTDGFIGLSNLYAFSFTGNPSAGQYDAIGAFEHELSEVMGRVGSVGSLFGANVYTPLDMFRFSSPGVHDLSAGPGYFSVDNGNTNLGTYNNPLNGGDASDWTPSLAGDSYGSGYQGLVAAVSHTDIIEDSVLGYRMTPFAVAQTNTAGLA